MIEWWCVLLLLGVAVGWCAGLFGIGGGTLMVPVLTMLFVDRGVDEASALHLALGSSMASIVATACASAWAHYKLDSIRWKLVAQLAPGVMIGTALVALWVPDWDARLLAISFAIYIMLVAIQMLRSSQPTTQHRLPGSMGMTMLGGGIGGVSALVSIGGGSMVVPLLSWGGVVMQQAIGTSAAIGVAISVVGTICYGIASTSPMVEGVTGIIYWPAVLLISLVSIIMAPVGARWSQRLPAPLLRRGYALLLLLVCASMLWTLFGTPILPR